MSSTKNIFDIIAISEARIIKANIISFLNNLNLNNYSFEFTETSASGTFLYIANHLSYKCWNWNWNLLLLNLPTSKQHWKKIAEIPQKHDFLTWSIQNFERKVRQFPRK